MDQFNARSTADEVLAGVELNGKSALITGVSAGLGIETARALLAHGASVIGAARDLEKAAKATAALAKAFGDRFSLVELDLASLASVRACADTLVAEGRPLDFVIANAGIMATPFERTADGFELQFGTNHLGHFVLVNRVAELMPEGARLIVLSSSAHHFSDIDLDDPNFERKQYDPIDAYGASKTANALFAVEFDRRHKACGVRAIAVHPGNIFTELIRYMPPELIEKMAGRSEANAKPGTEMFMKSVEQGSATTIWAAVAPIEVVAGQFCEDCSVAEHLETGGGVRPYAIDPNRAKALWTKSEEIVSEAFPIDAD